MSWREPTRAEIWEMYSLRVDEVWHQFILYTSQYGEFCRRFFGHYVHHAPSNAPQSGAATTLPVASFSDFCSRYQELFGSRCRIYGTTSGA